MRHGIFIRGHSEQDYCIYCDNKYIVLSQNVNRFSHHESLLINPYFNFILQQLFLSLNRKMCFSPVHKMCTFIRTTCYHISDVTSQFFQNPEIWITHLPHFKHIQLFEFSLGFGYCHFFFQALADITYFLLSCILLFLPFLKT